MTRTKLRAVPKPVEKEPDYAKDIYAEAREAALDAARWARMHVEAGRREPLDLFIPPHKRTWASWGR